MTVTFVFHRQTYLPNPPAPWEEEVEVRWRNHLYQIQIGKNTYYAQLLRAKVTEHRIELDVKFSKMKRELLETAFQVMTEQIRRQQEEL